MVRWDLSRFRLFFYTGGVEEPTSDPAPGSVVPARLNRSRKWQHECTRLICPNNNIVFFVCHNNMVYIYQN
jgi:hypothetical protein